MTISGIDSPVYQCTVKNMPVVARALVIILLPKHRFESLPPTSVDYIVDTTKVQPRIVADQAAMTPATGRLELVTLAGLIGDQWESPAIIK